MKLITKGKYLRNNEIHFKNIYFVIASHTLLFEWKIKDFYDRYWMGMPEKYIWHKIILTKSFLKSILIIG